MFSATLLVFAVTATITNISILQKIPGVKSFSCILLVALNILQSRTSKKLT